MMHGEAETGLAEVSWACGGNGCGSRGVFRICNMDLYLFELTTYLFELKALIRSNCASSNFDLVASCAFSIKSIPLPIMSAESLSQPDHGASSDGDSSTDIELFPGEKRYKAMRHNQSNLALPLQDTVIYLLPTSYMSALRRELLLPEIRRKGGQVTTDPSIATHCVVTPFPLDDVLMKRRLGKYTLPDNCICVPDTFLFTTPEVEEQRAAVMAQYEGRSSHEAMSHTVTEGTHDAVFAANYLRIPLESRVAGDEHAA
jgi:hypothetical protein